ncbi:MAG TPA: tyrosine-protein phosphatase [Roseiarcus sp.]|nr:tyrosine-protein phosphatase [Roseiarcus sp.]
MSANLPRRLEFEGAVNFRDLGGYSAAGGRRTRWRRLFRSDSLADLTADDLRRLQALHVQGLIDFRTEAERRLKPNRLPPGSPIRTLAIGFLPEGTLQMLEEVRAGAISTAQLERRVMSQYRKFGVDHVEQYRQAFDFAADARNYPLLIHCTSGKDRTGFASALLLLAVGVPRDVVMHDYELTNQYRRDVSHLFGPATPDDVIALLLSAQSHYLEAALDEIVRVHGSFEAFLTGQLGLDARKRARLVELLTEP